MLNQSCQKSTKKHAVIESTNDWKNIYSIAALYLFVNHASRYIQEKNESKYLIFDNSVNENKERLKKYTDVWNEIENEIIAINGSKKKDYTEDYTKI